MILYSGFVGCWFIITTAEPLTHESAEIGIIIVAMYSQRKRHVYSSQLMPLNNMKSCIKLRTFYFWPVNSSVRCQGFGSEQDTIPRTAMHLPQFAHVVV